VVLELEVTKLVLGFQYSMDWSTWASMHECYVTHFICTGLQILIHLSDQVFRRKPYRDFSGNNRLRCQKGCIMGNKVSAKYRDVLEYIRMKKTASVVELTSVFFLSASTVRRILTSMEEENLVVRYHGGVAIKSDEPVDISGRNIKELREKSLIAREAASMVKDGMTIILLGGTTVHAMCPYLKGRQITVITTSFPVVMDLMCEDRMKLIMLGGVVNAPELEVRGSLLISGLEKLQADILFLGATSIHPVRGIMTDDPEALNTYRYCIGVAEKSVVLADSTKFRLGGGSVVGLLSEVSCIITDSALPRHIIDSMGSVNQILRIVKI
jgi:DeoR/GlpR family transcriptional regulator of sugar metabolism